MATREPVVEGNKTAERNHPASVKEMATRPTATPPSEPCKPTGCKRVCPISDDLDQTDPQTKKLCCELYHLESASSSVANNVSPVCIGRNENEVREASIAVNALPAPVLLNIFSKLSLGDRMHRAALVCKYWRDLTCDAQLWRTISLNGQVKVTTANVLRVTGYSDNVTSLDLTDCPLVDDDGLAAVLRQCVALQELTLTR